MPIEIRELVIRTTVQESAGGEASGGGGGSTEREDIIADCVEQVMTIFRWAGPFKGALQELLLILMNKEQLRKKINAQFTSKS